MNNANQPAFPFFAANGNGLGETVVLDSSNGGDQYLAYKPGLTKREYFAAHIMQGLAAKYTLNAPEDQAILSKMAVELTDNLLKELHS